MINDYAKNSFARLEEELALFSEMGILPIKRLAGSLRCVKDALIKLNDYVQENSFEDRQEEINFFKYYKPQFVAERLYAIEIFTIEAGKPLGDNGAIKSYYEEELKYIKRFFIKYQFLYQYYQLDAADLDNLFFVRGAAPSDILLPENPEVNSQFSTPCDYIFARFMAYEKVQEYLMNRIYRSVENDVFSENSKIGKALKWTGDKINLVELAYGIYNTSQINNGNVAIWEIIDWMEQTLQVNLKRYYQIFSEIKIRKSISKTRYLDHMQEVLTRHIEEGDAFQPIHPKPVSGSKSANKK
jgi:hypothetical protein